jgi:hypothetical protein
VLLSLFVRTVYNFQTVVQCQSPDSLRKRFVVCAIARAGGKEREGKERERKKKRKARKKERKKERKRRRKEREKETKFFMRRGECVVAE